MGIKDFWYTVAESASLSPSGVLGVTLHNEWLALYRDAEGKVTAVLDRCLHRSARLSKGRVVNGGLVCPYHGWRYGSEGRLEGIPSEGPAFAPRASRCLPRFAVVEQEGYIYVRLNPPPQD